MIGETSFRRFLGYRVVKEAVEFFSSPNLGNLPYERRRFLTGDVIFSVARP